MAGEVSRVRLHEGTMDEIKDGLQHFLSGVIDFKGQALADKFISAVTYGGVALSVLVGLIMQDFDLMMLGFVASYAAQLVLCLPIPIYRRNPVTWLKVAGTSMPSGEKIEINL